MKANRKIEGDSNCAMTFVYELLGEKWNIQIIQILTNCQYYENESMSYTDIYSFLPQISSKILSKRLKTLNDQNIIDVIKNEHTPKKLRYRLSEHGKRVVPILEQLRQWSMSCKKVPNKYCNSNQCKHAIDNKRFVNSYMFKDE
jgi:DNA-binding HxlR family transcriptional regulator